MCFTMVAAALMAVLLYKENGIRDQKALTDAAYATSPIPGTPAVRDGEYEKDVEKLDVRIANMTTQAEDREGNKEVALGTSKIVSRPSRDRDGVIRLTVFCRTTSTHV